MTQVDDSQALRQWEQTTRENRAGVSPWAAMCNERSSPASSCVAPNDLSYKIIPYLNAGDVVLLKRIPPEKKGAEASFEFADARDPLLDRHGIGAKIAQIKITGHPSHPIYEFSFEATDNGNRFQDIPTKISLTLPNPNASEKYYDTSILQNTLVPIENFGINHRAIANATRIALNGGGENVEYLSKGMKVLAFMIPDSNPPQFRLATKDKDKENLENSFTAVVGTVSPQNGKYVITAIAKDNGLWWEGVPQGFIRSKPLDANDVALLADRGFKHRHMSWEEKQLKTADDGSQSVTK